MDKHQTQETGSEAVSGEPSSSASSENISSTEHEATSDVADEEIIPDGEPEIQAQLAKAKEETRGYQDRLTRLAAEFDNYKKRTNREFGTLVKNANEALISVLLPTLDNIERALQSPQETEEIKLFAQGIEMIQQQLWDTLRKEGLKEIDAIGQPFDPTKHEAIMAIESNDHPAETVVAEVERGYTLNDKVLRPSKVVVSRVPAQTTEDNATSA